MERFLKSPHLPKSHVTTLVIGEKYKKTAEYLNALGIKTLTLSENAHLDSEISCHADMLTLHLGENNFVLDAGQKILAEHLTECGANVILQKGIGSPYPNDTILNKLILKGKIYGNFKCTNISNTAFLPENAEKINVNQGYTKCSIAPVSDNKALTSDFLIHEKLISYNIDCLYINPKVVYLKGYDNGFIGGSTGLINEKIFLSTGKIFDENISVSLKEFIQSSGYLYDEATSEQITDLGTLLPII